MKKILTLLLLFVVGFSVVSCKKENNNGGTTPVTPVTQQLAAPVISLSESTVSWTAVANASSYVVYNGTAVVTTVITTTFDASTITATGTHSITVVAKAQGFTDSVKSNAVTYTVAEKEPESDIPSSVTEALYDVNVKASTWGKIIEGKSVYSTTVGQADLATVKNLIKNGGLPTTDFTENNTLAAATVPNGSVVFLVCGGSNKGISGAGTTIAAEVARADAFADRADKGEITLIVIHVGGSTRRGTTSDQFIQAVTPSADLVLVYNAGNADHYFTGVCFNNNISLYTFSSVAKMLDSFKILIKGSTTAK